MEMTITSDKKSDADTQHSSDLGCQIGASLEFFDEQVEVILQREFVSFPNFEALIHFGKVIAIGESVEDAWYRVETLFNDFRDFQTLFLSAHVKNFTASKRAANDSVYAIDYQFELVLSATFLSELQDLVVTVNKALPNNFEIELQSPEAKRDVYPSAALYPIFTSSEYKPQFDPEDFTRRESLLSNALANAMSASLSASLRQLDADLSYAARFCNA